IPGGVSIKNIETVNITRDSASGSFNASVFGGATQIWQIDDAAAIEGLVEGQTAGFRDTAAASVAYDDDVTTASVALDNAANGSTVTVVGSDIETVNVSGSTDAAAASSVTVDLGNDTAGADSVTALNLSLEGDVNLTVTGSNGAELETVDASGTTGGITYALTSAADDVYALETITGGAGNDMLTIADLGDLSADTFAVSGGAGNDVMEITAVDNGTAATAVAVTVNGGAGNDTLKLGTLANVADASEDNFMDSLITFADFNGDEDVLDLNGTTLNTLSNTQRANIAAEDNLYDALVNAAAQTGAGTVAFDFGGDAYIYTEDATDGFSNGDGLVKLAGFSVENFDASNLI
ncbi:hypothetical protein ACGYLG_19465, partial [Sulfitobacter sp. MOLA879]